MEFYHGENHQMWRYCLPLGQFVDKDGNKYDLGVYEEKTKSGGARVSFAIVYGSKDQEYISGDINLFYCSSSEERAETLKRYKKQLTKKGSK